MRALVLFTVPVLLLCPHSLQAQVESSGRFPDPEKASRPEIPEIIRADEPIELITPIEVKEFRPPDGAKTKPLPVMKELNQLVRAMPNGESLITRWVEPIEAEYGKKTKAAPEIRSELSEEKIVALMEEYEREEWLSISATVYDERVSLVRWRHEKEEYFCWSNVHFGHLSGVGQFRAGKKRYSLWMGWSRMKSEWLAEDAWPGPPPELPEGLPQFETIGEVPDEALETVTLLHKIYAREGKRLAEAYAKRREANEARKKWQAENPPPPREIEVILWPSRTARFMTRPIPYDEEGVRARLAERRQRGEAVLTKIAAEKARWNQVPTLTLDQ